ncbi:MAG: hypothetical protein DMF49_06815 [Acidobacteria bacterium]|nr:MAG: hypothetical protein DMF49_06815 [Acidobacteriota bacterium]
MKSERLSLKFHVLPVQLCRLLVAARISNFPFKGKTQDRLRIGQVLGPWRSTWGTFPPPMSAAVPCALPDLDACHTRPAAR